MILRTILGTKSKVAVETLYLETSALSIKHLITVRRIMYLKNILNKHEDKVVSKVYSAMKNSPLKGDWYNLIQSDFERIGMTLNEKMHKRSRIYCI